MSASNGTEEPPSGGGVLDDLLEKVRHLMEQCRGSRKLILLIVAIGLLLDNMLLTAVGKWVDVDNVA